MSVSISTQPVKIGGTGGAQIPVARQIPVGQSAPIEHESVPSAQTMSFWMPVNAEELPP